jgi:hypothetical protein
MTATANLQRLSCRKDFPPAVSVWTYSPAIRANNRQGREKTKFDHLGEKTGNTRTIRGIAAALRRPVWVEDALSAFL